MANGYDELGELGATLSPAMASGADIDEMLASGDPNKYIQSLKFGPRAAQMSASPVPIMPVTNAPNPPAETTRTPAVPATVTPSGTAPSTASAQPAAPPQSAFARAGFPDPNAIESKLVQASAPMSAQNPQGVPNPRDPAYRPSAGRRIARGVLGGLAGLAEGGIKGALVGALEPQATTGTAYSAGNRAFQTATARNQMLQDSLKQQLTQESASAETAEKLSKAEGERLVTITQDEAKQIGNPALAGQPVSQSALQHLMTNANTVQGRKDVATMNNATKKEIADASNLTKEDIAKLKPEQKDDRAIRLMSKAPDDRTQEENAYLAGYSRLVNETKTQPGVQRALAFAQYRPVQTIDADGNVHYDYSGHAIASGAAAPSSIPFRTAASVAKAFTSGPQAAQLTAFRTATDHLQLMRQAADALHNNDIQKLNQLTNEFKTQFGRPAPTNAKALAEMLSGELAGVLSKGGATVSEIDEMRKQINANIQSPEQMGGIIDTNQNVINEKANELLQQYVSGMQGGPVFEPLSQGGTQPTQAPKTPSRFPAPKAPTSTPPPAGATHTVTDAKGNTIGYVVKGKYQAVGK